MNDRFNARVLYDVYKIAIQFRGRLYGGVPKNPDMIGDWIKSKIGIEDEVTEAITAEAQSKMIDTETEKSWNGFYRDEKKGVYIECRQMKAAIKQCASVLGITRKRIGSKQILSEGGECKALDGGDRLYLGKPEADGYEEKPIHVTTPQGPRSALKRVDYVENARLEFEVWVLQTESQEKRHIGEEELVQILTMMQENGVGADRSQGGGKFDIAEFEKVQSGLSRSGKEEPPLATIGDAAKGRGRKKAS
jgi:hypothetical protein